MAVVEISFTADQLASAYAQLSDSERRLFLEAVFADPAHQQAALQLLKGVQAVLARKLSPAKQRLLDRLLDKKAQGKLRAVERKQLEQLMDEYGRGLMDKARARYTLELARRAASEGH